MTVTHLLAVMVGGAVGTGARFCITQSLQRDELFPFGTLSVNVLGCFAIGLCVTYFGELSEVSPLVRLSIIVGFLGGFTTFSSFGLEAVKLIEAQRLWAASLYLVASNLSGLLAVYFGMKLAAFKFSN